MLTPENLHMLRHHPDPEIADTEAQQTILYLLDHIDKLESLKSERDALANSGALVPVRVGPKPIGHDGWFMTPTGLGWWGSDGRGDPCVETPTHYYDYNHCYPVRLVPIAEWEAEG